MFNKIITLKNYTQQYKITLQLCTQGKSYTFSIIRYLKKKESLYFLTNSLWAIKNKMSKIPLANCYYILKSVHSISSSEIICEKYFFSQTRGKYMREVCFFKEATQWETTTTEIIICSDLTCLLFEHGNCPEELTAWIIIGELIRTQKNCL